MLAFYVVAAALAFGPGAGPEEPGSHGTLTVDEEGIQIADIGGGYTLGFNTADVPALRGALQAAVDALEAYQATNAPGARLWDVVNDSEHDDDGSTVALNEDSATITIRANGFPIVWPLVTVQGLIGALDLVLA